MLNPGLSQEFLDFSLKCLLHYFPLCVPSPLSSFSLSLFFLSLCAFSFIPLPPSFLLPTNKSLAKNAPEKEKEKQENSWTAPPKIQVDVDDLLQRAKAISSEVQEHGLMFNLEEVRQDQKKERYLSLLWTNGHARL